MTKTIIYTIASIFVLLCSIALTIVPNLIDMGYHTDKMLHISAFAIATMFIIIRSTSLRIAVILIALLLCSGIAVEGIQIFIPDRAAQLGDVLSNIIGIIYGCIMGYFMRSGYKTT